MRWHDAHVCFGLIVEIVVELDNAIHLSADMFGGVVVVPRQRGIEFVVGSLDVGDSCHRMTVIEQFANTYVALESVTGRGDVDDTVSILCAVVRESGDITFKIYLTCMIIYAGINQHRLS